jgi:UDP-4-amino-4-deoxy-L-arabinose formyltransferase/UDP-glucuronic acid dehydrogenase (UDP-4-keto-hexauronic acid decarboxylating)
VATVAESIAVPVLPSTEVLEASFASWLRTEAVDLLLNAHSLHVIHEDVVAAPRIGSFNLHPGPLPEYAGLNAPSWAIYEGERRHAVTLHWMQPEVDAGAVAYASWFDVEDEDTGLSLSTKCIRAGVPLVGRLLRDAAENPHGIPAVPQDPGRRRYFRKGQIPDDGRVVWSRPGRRIVDLVRASDFFPFASPWGEPVASFQDEPISVLKASGTGERTTAEPGTVGSVSEQGARVAAGDEWVLVQRVRLHDGPLPAGQLLRTGARLEDGVP